MPPLSFTAFRLPLLQAVSAILAHIKSQDDNLGLLSVENYTLTATASTNGAGARYTLNQGIAAKSAGVCAIDLDLLAKTLAASNGDSVQIAAKSSTIEVTTGSGQFDFATADPQIIAVPTPHGPQVKFDIAGERLHSLVHRVIHAVEKHESDSHSWKTNSVSLSVFKKKLTLAATDTFHLPLDCATITLLEDSAKSGSYLLPPKGLRAFALASESEATVHLTLSDSLAILECGPLTAWMPTVHGTFPPVDLALAEPPNSFTVPTAEILNQAELALLFADAEEPVVVFSTAPGIVTLSAESSTLTGFRATKELAIPVPNFTGPRAVFALDCAKLVRTLSAYCDEENVTVAFYAKPTTTTENGVVIVAGSARCLMCRCIHKEREMPKRERA